MAGSVVAGEDVRHLAALFDQAQVVGNPCHGVAGVAGDDLISGLAHKVDGGRVVGVAFVAQRLEIVAGGAELSAQLGRRGGLDAGGHGGLDASQFLTERLQAFVHGVIALFVVGVVAHNGCLHSFVVVVGCDGLGTLAGDFGGRIRGDAGNGNLEQVHFAAVYLGNAVVRVDNPVFHRPEADAEAVVDAFTHQFGGLAPAFGVGQLRHDVQAVRFAAHVGQLADKVAMLAAHLHGLAGAEVAIGVYHLGIITEQRISLIEGHGHALQGHAVAGVVGVAQA